MCGVSFQDFREFAETRPLHVVAKIAIVTLTPEQVSDLFGGLWYISMETADFPEGEIRGQIQLVVSRVRRLADRSVAGVCVAMVERRP
jgi:CHRD domain